MIRVPRLCTKCGSEISADAPEGGCPRCLLETALDATDGPVPDDRSGEQPKGGDGIATPQHGLDGRSKRGPVQVETREL